MFKINKVILDSECAVKSVDFKGKDTYCRDDICVSITDGGVDVCADKTPVSTVRIVFENNCFDEGLVLGDAFERAYGDLGWKSMNIENPMPWYFFADTESGFFGVGVKVQPNAFCTWYCDKEEIILELDIRNGSNPIVLNNRTLHACDIITAKYASADLETMNGFCRLMSEYPRKTERPIFGGNDWYCNYGNNSRGKILDMTAKIVECSPKDSPYKPYMVIDDGWEVCHCAKSDGCPEYNGGPWRVSNRFFGDMQSLAEEIEKLGAIPGIWIRPLLTTEKVHDECVLRKKAYQTTLDPSSELVLDMVREDMQRLRAWGYKLIKHDFSTFDIFGKWGFEMSKETAYDIQFHDKTKTTAEIIKALYRTIREGAGEDTLIMGCNTVSHLSAGVFDIQRTGDDTSGIDWERTKKYGLNTLAFRMEQHKAFYLADADCVGITKNIPWKTNRQWLDVLAKSGTPLFVSVAEDAYTEDVKQDITKAFETAVKASNTSCPLDWKTTLTPTKWKSDFGTDCYTW